MQRPLYDLSFRPSGWRQPCSGGRGLLALYALRGRSLKIFGAWHTVAAGQLLRKEVMPMVQFLLDVLAGFLAAVLAALFNRHFDD